MTAAPRYGIAPPHYRLPDDMRLGPVLLQVANLARSVAYYRDVIGLSLLSSNNGVSLVGIAAAPGNRALEAPTAQRVLFELHELVGATPVVSGKRFGLFHVAILLPDRAALGRFLVHLASRNEPAGMSDHAVSEAVYLSDPDGHGLEIYADRPRSAWKSRNGQLAMGTEPLDTRAVIAEANGVAWSGAPAGTRIGHVHLHVGAIDEASDFYHETLGFDKMVWEYPGALFLAAGGYHHHLGTNTWARNASTPADNEARLLAWTIELPSRTDVEAFVAWCADHQLPCERDGEVFVLHDPWGTAIRICTADSP